MIKPGKTTRSIVQLGPLSETALVRVTGGNTGSSPSIDVETMKLKRVSLLGVEIVDHW